LTAAEIEEEGPEGEAGVDEGIVDEVSDEEDVMFMGSGGGTKGVTKGAGGQSGVAGGVGVEEFSNRFPSPNPSVDAVTWWAEVERSSARLRVPVRLGGGSGVPLGFGGRLGGGSGGGHPSPLLSLGEWRGHLESTQSAGKTVTKLATPLFSSLRTLNGELVEALGSLAARETALNTAYTSQVQAQAEGAAKASTLRSQVTGAQARVTGLSTELAAIDEATEEVKAALDDFTKEESSNADVHIQYCPDTNNYDTDAIMHHITNDTRFVPH